MQRLFVIGAVAISGEKLLGDDGKKQFASSDTQSGETEPIGVLQRRSPVTGELLYEERRAQQGESSQVLSKHMFHQGVSFGLYPEEREKDPERELSPDQYLDFLATALDTHEKRALFFEKFFAFTWDSPNPLDPLEEGTKQHHGDYVQPARDTVQRVKNGCMQGDCDDHAELARVIVRLQGHSAHAIHIPGDHILCAWIEKRGGKYDGFVIDTGGRYAKNGAWYLAEDDEKDIGAFETPEEAYAALMKRYDDTADPNSIDVRYDPSGGENQRKVVTLSAFLQPVDLAMK